MKIVVFGLETGCLKCKQLEAFLDNKGIAHEIIDMQSPEGMTELRFNSVFTFDAPVLQVGEEFILTKQMFKGTALQEDFVLGAISNGNRD